MNKEVAAFLKNKIVGISFFDVVAGIAQPVTVVTYDSETSLRIAKKQPVSYDMASGKNPFLGMEQQLVPSESKRSIVYFEDFGTTSDPNGPAGTHNFISQIRLVAWMNKNKMNNVSKYTNVTSKCINEILHRLIQGKAFNGGGLTRLFVSNPRIPIQDANIFSRYNYDEVESQFLRPPFEYFAIDFTCKYQMKSIICGGGEFVPTVYEQMPIEILIKDNPLALSDPANVQTLWNGWKVPKEYPAGTSLTIGWLVGYSVLQPIVIQNRNVSFPPFDPYTATFNFAGTDTEAVYGGDTVVINASLPKSTL